MRRKSWIPSSNCDVASVIPWQRSRDQTGCEALQTVASSTLISHLLFRTMFCASCSLIHSSLQTLWKLLREWAAVVGIDDISTIYYKHIQPGLSWPRGSLLLGNSASWQLPLVIEVHSKWGSQWSALPRYAPCTHVMCVFDHDHGVAFFPSGRADLVEPAVGQHWNLHKCLLHSPQSLGVKLCILNTRLSLYFHTWLGACTRIKSVEKWRANFFCLTWGNVRLMAFD